MFVNGGEEHQLRLSAVCESNVAGSVYSQFFHTLTVPNAGTRIWNSVKLWSHLYMYTYCLDSKIGLLCNAISRMSNHNRTIHCKLIAECLRKQNNSDQSCVQTFTMIELIFIIEDCNVLCSAVLVKAVVTHQCF